MKSDMAVTFRPDERIRTLLRQIHLAGPGGRHSRYPGKAVVGYAGTASAAGGGRGFPLCSGQVEVKESLGHVIDTERVFSYRALHCAQRQNSLAGFEQDDYVKYGPFAQCSLAALLQELSSVRKATLALFQALDEAAWTRRGVASNNEVTVRALAYTIAGHELHHRKLFQQKYFPARAS